jgi:hypothetical protein
LAVTPAAVLNSYVISSANPSLIGSNGITATLSPPLGRWNTHGLFRS